MAIPVHETMEVKAARCTSCMSCIDSCPMQKEGALAWEIGAGKKRALRLSIGGSKIALVTILLLSLSAAVAASYLIPLPSFFWSRGNTPKATETVSLKIKNLSCRGRASLLIYYLERDDDLEIPGYLKVEAWPGPGFAPLRITFDPAQTGRALLKMAITEPYYDSHINTWRSPPFRIEGYDPLGE